MSGSSHKGEGVGSTHKTDRHQFYGWGRWWVSEEEFQKYRDRQVLTKRARNAGYDYTQLDEFVEMERHVLEAVDTTRKKDKRITAELRRLKKKHGLPAHCNRMHLKAVYNRTRDPEIGKFLLLQDRMTTTDAEKIARIRKLFLSGKNPYDILYETALMVGIGMRKK
jgi:hypothetical protein